MILKYFWSFINPLEYDSQLLSPIHSQHIQICFSRASQLPSGGFQFENCIISMIQLKGRNNSDGIIDFFRFLCVFIWRTRIGQSQYYSSHRIEEKSKFYQRFYITNSKQWYYLLLELCYSTAFIHIKTFSILSKLYHEITKFVLKKS